MKVLVLNNTRNYAGSNISFLTLASGLKSYGVEFVMAGPAIENEYFQERLRELNIEYVQLFSVNYVYPKINSLSIKHFILSVLAYPYRLIRLIIGGLIVRNEIYKIIDRCHPDLIHSNSGVIHDGIICAKKRGIPHIIHLREYQDLDFNYKIYPSKRAFINLLKTTNVISITQDISHHFKLDDYNKSRVIYNGINPGNATAFMWPKLKYFLCCSRIAKIKGHEDVIDAFAQFCKTHDDYKLILLGSGSAEYLRKLKQYAESLGCGDKIEWKGFCSNTVEYMKNATALIVASYNEGFGRMTAEAIFAGCITIGRNTGGTKEILENTGGLLFDDNSQIVKRMEQVVSFDREIYSQYIYVSQDYAKKNYSIEANVSKTYEFYREVISEQSN